MSSYTIRSCSAEDYAGVCAALAQTMQQPIPFLQAPFYGSLQAASGKQVVYFCITKDTETVGCGLGVQYRAPGGFRFLYCPYGPVVREANEELLADLKAFFRPLAHKLGCAFVRLDDDTLAAASPNAPVASKLARMASLQPRAEWVLDISPDEESVWMGFHKHARYNIRLAERANANIAIYKASEAPLETFYSLMQTTSKRDNFEIFDKAYYESYLKTLDDKEGFIVLVSIDGKPAATGLFACYDGQAHYVFAGSSDDFRKIAPAYTVIWSAMKEAKQRGCTLFNFGGVSDTVKGQHLGGVTGFKKRFGGFRVEHRNPLDLVYKKLPYTLFKTYKSLR